MTPSAQPTPSPTARLRDASATWENVAYPILALLVLATLYYMVYFNPVLYAHMVTEDRFGEWFTAIGYGCSGVLLGFMAWKYATGVKRALWSLMGVVLIVLAGEEISWGQRVFHIRTPENFVDLNLQAEMNLHNLAALGNFNSAIYSYLTALILFWIVFSGVLKLRAPAWQTRLTSWGFPLYPPKLLPLLLLPTLMWTLFPQVKSDETGEFLLSLAVFVWVADAYLENSPLREANETKRAAAAFLALFVVVGLTQVACWKRPGSLTYRLNNLAADFYPGVGMHAQAEALFQYIYAHPEYATTDTRINHGRALAQRGMHNEAAATLAIALNDVEKDNELDETEKYLRYAAIADILGETDKAKKYFDETMHVVETKLSAASSPVEQVTLMYRQAKILEARGDIEGSIAQTDAAKAAAKAAGVKVSRLR